MKNILRNFTSYVDGNSQHLTVTELTPPEVMDKSEAARGGGMLGEVDVAVGLEKMAAAMKMQGRDPALMARAGMAPGTRERITYRGFTVSEIDGSEHAEMLIIEGRIQQKGDAWKTGSIVGVSYPITSITYYKHVIDGQLIHEIDMVNAIQIVNGIDQGTGMRTALGLAAS
jgi:hypothetical protein